MTAAEVIDKQLWEELEEFVFNSVTEEFTVHDVATSFGITTRSASLMIQSYLRAQRNPESSALYTLRRRGRTKNAVWVVGDRARDAQALGETLFDDFAIKVARAYEPDLRHMAMRNPRAAKFAEKKIEAVTVGALVVLKNALDGYVDD